MTLKNDKGNRKWYEQAKLNEYSSSTFITHARFELSPIHENSNVKVSGMSGKWTGQQIGPTLIITYTQVFHVSQSVMKVQGI